MTLVRAMAILQGPTGMAEDRYINTFHFLSAGLSGISQDLATNIGSSLDIFYGFIDPYIRTELVRVDYRLYDLDDPTPREPTMVEPVAQPSSVAPALPFEVASVLSFYSNRNIPRQRGRLYLGPLTDNATEARSGLVEPGPSADFRDDALDAAVALQAAVQSAGGDGAATWGVYSPTSAATGGLGFYAISDAWMDDALDTQRRRGTPPSARTSIVVPN